jgi:hypothetical protein
MDATTDRAAGAIGYAKYFFTTCLHKEVVLLKSWRCKCSSDAVDSSLYPYQNLHTVMGCLGSRPLPRWRVRFSVTKASLLWIVLFLLVASAGIPLLAHEKDGVPYGEGLIVNIPLPINEVTQAVRDVVDSGVIRGTKEYSKDENYVKKAEPAEKTSVFPAWKDPGTVFYKIRKQALDPWNFKNSSDVGTLAVRYVVQPQGDKNTVLRIDALFVEDDRHTAHPSNGSVENAEYKDIQEHLDATELLKKETEEALHAKQDHETKKDFGLDSETELLSEPPGSDESSSRQDLPASTSAYRSGTKSIGTSDVNETPEQHLASLRHEVERIVAKPGAPLKSAPFHSASTIKSLPSGTEVLIVIVTTYWLGVETHEGDHGWIRRNQLEFLP